MPNRTSVPPGPPGLPLIGSLRDYQRDPLRLFIRAADRYGDVVRFNMAGKTVIAVNRSELVGQVLQDIDGYPKSSNYDILKELCGEGLITSQGPTWRAHRKLMQPPLAKARVGAFFQRIQVVAQACIERWLARDPDEVVDLYAETTWLTQVVVGRCFFDVDLSDQAAKLSEALAYATHYINDRMEAFFLVPTQVPTPRRLKFKRALETLDRAIYDMIARRRHQASQQNDLLALLIAAGGEGELSDRELRDEAVTMFAAGHETTAAAMAWTLYLLSLYPTEEEKLVGQIFEIAGNDPITLEMVDQMDYLEQVINESMRLYPPAWSMSRSCRNGDTIGGYDIEPGTMIVISPYVLHRQRDIWPNPEGFDPRRWTDDEVRKRPRYSYLPFGGGPRVCIGSFFSLLELKICLAELLRRFRVELSCRTQVQPRPGITLQPREGIPVKLVRR